MTTESEVPGGSQAPYVVEPAHDDEGEELPSGWSMSRPEHIPRPTYWPAVIALSTTLIVWGWITSYIVTGVGIVLFAISLAGWIGELQHGE